MQFSRYIVICTWIVASLRRQHLRAMNIHGIRTHPQKRLPLRVPFRTMFFSLYKTLSGLFSLKHWQPPALPCRLQQSTIGRLSLNRRVRDGNGCFPQAHRYQKCCYSICLDNSTVKHIQYSTFSSVLVGLIQPFLQPT